MQRGYCVIALDLMRELGGAEDRTDSSYIHQPSISDTPQNRDYRDWTSLIELVRDAWLATTARFPERAQLEVQRWLAMPYPLFRRLVFFAATDTNLFQSRQALEWLLADEHWWLWSVETQREALRLLVTIAPRLDEHNRETLEQVILEGPPRAMFEDDIETVQLQRIIDREVWLRLAKERATRNEIGVNAANRLGELSHRYPQWRLAADERDEFPLWMGNAEDLVKFKVTPKHRRDLVLWLRENPNSDHWHEDDWRERCKRDFPPTASAMLMLAQRGEWLQDRWREALQAWADEKLAVRSWRYMGKVLALAPDELIKQIAHALSSWLQAIAKIFRGNDTEFFLLIRRILVLYVGESVEPADDPVFRAINHPVGHVTEAALRWWYRQSLEDNQRLPEVLKDIFTELCKIEVVIFRHGRLLLATHVITLFRVDREWDNTVFTACVRLGTLARRSPWSVDRLPLVSPIHGPSNDAIKIQFLATAQYFSDLGEFGERYAAFLTFTALEHGDTFSRKPNWQSRPGFRPADGLRSAAEALARAMGSAGEQRAEYWRNRLVPYLKSIWPKSHDVNTQAISENLAELCIEAQDAFPEAIDELKYWLRPIDFPDSIVNWLYETKLCERFPEPALAFLNVVIDDNAQ